MADLHLSALCVLLYAVGPSLLSTRGLTHLVCVIYSHVCKHTHAERSASLRKHRRAKDPPACTNHLLKLLWRSWQLARGRHDFGSHSCLHQPSEMFLGVDPWQPLLPQSTFITVKFYKRGEKPSLCILTEDCQCSCANSNSHRGSWFAFEGVF